MTVSSRWIKTHCTYLLYFPSLYYFVHFVLPRATISSAWLKTKTFSRSCYSVSRIYLIYFLLTLFACTCCWWKKNVFFFFFPILHYVCVLCVCAYLSFFLSLSLSNIITFAHFHNQSPFVVANSTKRPQIILVLIFRNSLILLVRHIHWTQQHFSVANIIILYVGTEYTAQILIFNI